MPECLSLHSRVHVSVTTKKQPPHLLYGAVCVQLPCIFISSPEQKQVAVSCGNADVRYGLPLLTVCACLWPVTQQSLLGPVWTNDNRKAMATQAQSSQQIWLFFSLIVCLFLSTINPSFFSASLLLSLSFIFSLVFPLHVSFLTCSVVPSGLDWRVDAGKMWAQKGRMKH